MLWKLYELICLSFLRELILIFHINLQTSNFGNKIESHHMLGLGGRWKVIELPLFKG